MTETEISALKAIMMEMTASDLATIKNLARDELATRYQAKQPSQRKTKRPTITAKDREFRESWDKYCRR